MERVFVGMFEKGIREEVSFTLLYMSEEKRNGWF